MAALARLGRVVRRLVRGGRTGRCVAQHAAVLDGFTLSIEGTLAGASPHSRLTLVLTNAETGATQTAPALNRGAADGRVRFSVAVPLGDEEHALSVTPGRWDVGIASGADSSAEPVTMGAELDDDGPTILNPRAPRTGIRYVPRATMGGRLWLSVKVPPPHAEVERLWPRAGNLLVDGRVLGDVATGGAEIVLNNRDSAEIRSAPLTVGEQGTFSIEIPTDLLTVHGSDTQRWNVSLTLPGDELVVGRLLDDARRPRDVYEFPPVVINPSSPTATRVRAYFSESQRLMITCKPLRGGEETVDA